MIIRGFNVGSWDIEFRNIYELNLLAANRIKIEAAISRILIWWWLFLIPIILEISKIKIEVLFPTLCFQGPGIPSSPPQGEGYKAQRIQKWEKLEYWNTVKIIWYIFVIIFYKTFLIIKTK